MVVDLALWGVGVPIDEGADPRTARAALLALVRCATVAPEVIDGVDEIYDFSIAGERFHVIVDDGVALPRSGPAPTRADVTVECELATLLKLDAGELTVAQARRDHQAKIDGKPAAGSCRVFAIFRCSS